MDMLYEGEIEETEVIAGTAASDEEQCIFWWAFWSGVFIALPAMLWWIGRRAARRAQQATFVAARPPSIDLTAIPPVIEAAREIPLTETALIAATETVEPSPEPVDPSAVTPVIVVAADNLTRIEGIGPKTAAVLQQAGISTFTQLAAMELPRLQQILQAAALRLADPVTWPEQATLAARGDWSALETLQATLKGGRRVPDAAR